MEEVIIDVRDIDYTWFIGVQAFLDRDADLYYLPRESADRLGEPDDETGDYFLLDGQVTARADEIEVAGVRVPAWSVGTTQILTRPAEKRA
jgi:hypothetical protein